ncbi:DUF6789 family protein [Rhizobium mayense]|uniref:DUF2938 domain-containing protein n=1 Tax=Rhizobium mayense TaxID=1312184 RepID=A0ABT7JXF0_9HYPH|nr:DUF6789 family protein [Rhizobium mayense]MDL2399604.1 hypothetical protein [Rhizobium mayense]
MNVRQFFHPTPMTLDVRAGLIAGFTATVVLSILMIAQSSAGLLPQLNPIEDIAHVAGQPAGTILSLLFGWIGHFVLGTIVWGIIYAAIQASLPGTPVVRGLIFGALAWLAMMIIFMPLAGHGLFALSLGGQAAVATLVLHLVYGAVLGVAYARVAHEWHPLG